MSSEKVNLRSAAMRGGVYLAGRQAISIILKMVGVLVITRILGPAGYGAYVSGYGVYQYLLLLGQAGIGVYLLRQDGEVSPRTYAVAYTLLLVMTLIMMGALLFSLAPLSDWVGVEGFSDVAFVLIFALPFQLMAVPATVTLERALNYKAVAFIEIFGQIFFYIVAVPLALSGLGPVSLGVGWVAQQAVTCIATLVLARARPSFAFDWTLTKKIVGYAASYSFSNWIWQLRVLINPLIAAPTLGAEAVGLIGMAIGLLEMLSVLKTIAWRLSVAVLARFQDDIDKLRMAIREGMELQALAIGSSIVGFGFLGDFLIPLVFGDRWTPVMHVYPYIALGYFTNALFNMHSSVLSLLKRNFDTARFHIVHVCIFASVAYITVPKIGIIGYGLGEVAALASYVVIHLYTTRAVGSPYYLPVATWWIGIAIGLFWRDLGLWAIAAPFVALAIPPSPARLFFYYKKIRKR